MMESDKVRNSASGFQSEGKTCSFAYVDESRDDRTAISNFSGCLLQSISIFPYFFLLAFETGWLLRCVMLVLVSPFTCILSFFWLEETAIRILVFVALAGVKMVQIEMLSRSVLPKFFSDDVHTQNLKLFMSFGKRLIVTEMPRVMVEPFAKEHLGAAGVIGTELAVNVSGRATGFVRKSGVLVGENKKIALKATVADDNSIYYIDSFERIRGVPYPKAHQALLSLFKEVYIVTSKLPKTGSHENSKDNQLTFLKCPVIFSDGRLVQRPTHMEALKTLLWMPVGFLLALIRILTCQVVPMSILYYALTLLGVRIVVKGTPPPAASAVTKSAVSVPQTKGIIKNEGVVFVCNHRTLMDPVFLAIALRRHVTAVTFSLSRLSEIISPIQTVRLTRSKQEDAATMMRILKQDAKDLAICPEGTTCRSPYLLRFSSLFAEVSDQIVPVAMMNRTSVFHATSAGRWKAMDPFYFFMNPLPCYEVTFLDQLPPDQTCSGGNLSQHEVANNVQNLLAAQLKFQCTKLTRKDKYLALVGTDGTISAATNSSNKAAKISVVHIKCG